MLLFQKIHYTRGMDEWSSSQKLTDDQIALIFAEMDERHVGWINAKDIERRLIRFGEFVALHRPPSKRFTGLPNAATQATILFNAISKDSKIHYNDFYEFVRRREEKLLEVYRAVDTNNDGAITPDDLAKQLQQSEIFADHSVAWKVSLALISRMDTTGSGSISFREFSRVFVVLPECDVELIFNHWAKYSHIDMGEDYSLPDEPSVEKSRINIFLSGAIAGCVSRCVTAPLDRLKVIMQAGKGDATIVNMMRYMYHEGGLRGLWRGNGVNCLKIGPESAAKFLLYGPQPPSAPSCHTLFYNCYFYY
jgi:solute carrier family 25 (mitochondrial phosphate transporter), member 23/24/25/41